MVRVEHSSRVRVDSFITGDKLRQDNLLVVVEWPPMLVLL